MTFILWIKDAGIETVLESVLVPNQNNEFIQFNDIYLDENIDNELKEILTSLGGKIKEQLLNKDIVAFNDYFNNQSSKVKTNAICANEIDSKVSQLLTKETIDNIERTENTQKYLID